jgi:hypothetical protein
MFEFRLGNRHLHLGGLDFHQRQFGAMEAKVYLANSCPRPDPDVQARLVVSQSEYTLRVVDYELPTADHSNGWIRLAAPAACARPYLAEVFSGAKGTTWQAVIQSRTAVNGPPALAQQLAAVTVDSPLTDLLDDVCARHTGWTWWTGTDAVEIGPPPDETRRMDGIVVSECPAGCVAILAEPPPALGAQVDLEGGRRGMVISTAIHWRAGALPENRVVLGSMPVPRRRRPTSEVSWSAVIRQVNPVVVELTDEEDPTRTYLSRARFMGRGCDAGCFQEDMPIQPNDIVLARVRLGGVSTAEPRVFLWRETLPASAYRIVSHSFDLTLAVNWTTHVQTIDEHFTSRESHVSRRWNVAKA